MACEVCGEKDCGPAFHLPEERRMTKPQRHRECCHDCGLSYGARAWADVVVPDEYWELINPTTDRGCGLLCFNCMVGRFKDIGIANVPYQIASGPFAFWPRNYRDIRAVLTAGASPDV